MSVNEKLMAPGTFNVFLNIDSTPNSVLNTISAWGNIVLTSTRINPDEFTDAQIRDMARYVGIVQSQTITDEGIEVGGVGILAYLGDTDSRGMVLARNAGVGAVRSYVTDTLDDVLDRSDSTPYGILRDEEANQRAVRKGTVTEVTQEETTLLFNFEGTDGDTTTTDGSTYTNNQVITFNGNSEISNSQAKFGSTSLKLTTDGYLLIADRPELDLTFRDFTIEWWEYRTSSSGNPTVAARTDDTYSPWIAGKLSGGNNRFLVTHDGDGYGESEDLNMSMGSINLNQWNHFAVSRKGGKFRTFKNGTKVTEQTRDELYIRVSSDSMQIGKGQEGNFFEGFIDGFRINKGSAVYWDNFTPDTSAPSTITGSKVYTGKHYMESAYKALKTVSVALDAEFKMNNDGTIDVGPRSALFTGHDDDEPTGMIVRRLSGLDAGIKGYSGADLKTEFNAEDYVSRVELIASNYGKEINLGQADAKSVPYKDLHGNTLERIQILSENDVPDSMRDIKAEAYLNEYNKVQKTLTVGLEDYDLSGDIGVGDVIYVYDPEVGFEDTQADATLENRDRYEIAYQGQILNPIKIRVMGLSFPVIDTMGVFYRDGDGNYTDLTDYVEFESGITQIDVGSTQPSINEDLRGSASIISVGGTNEFTVPDAPTNFTAATGTYQDGSGRPFAFAKLTWDEPTNTDGSRITDGNMYRVRYRQVVDVDGNNLIDSNDNQVTDYEYLTVEFGTQAVVIKGLGPSNTYEFGVAAIDNSGFSGGFSIITAQQMPVDGTIPPAPVAPTGTYGAIASNAAQIQISHKLAAAEDADGNPIASPTNFTLPRDIDHLNVYRSQDSTFTPSASTFVGEIAARAGHIDGQITAINTFIVSTAGTWYYKLTAVDVAGNESSPSTAQQAEHELITKEYIADAEITTIKIGEAQVTSAKIDTMTASKLDAGTITGKEIIIDTDNDDPSNPVLGTIRSDNYVANTSGWIIKSDGSVEFGSGKFRGDITGASGTFSGNLSAAGGTFSGNISANQISGGTISADLIQGGTIDGSDLNIGSGTFTVSNNGAMTANSATISGSINANSGTIGGTTINANTLTGGDPNNSTGYSIGANSATFHDVIITGTLSGATIDGVVSGTLATANSGQRIEFSNNGSAIMQFFSNSGQSGYVADVSGDLTLQAQSSSAVVLAGGTNGIKWSGAAYFQDGGSYSNTTNTNKVVRATSNGQPYWGNVPANAGVTAFSVNSNTLAVNDNVGSVVMSDNHTSNHHADSDHTGNGNSNLATRSYVNSRGFTGNNGNSNLTNANVDQSHGPHGNGNHNHTGTVLTTAGAGNLYATPSHGHSNFANSSHLHNYYAMNGHTHGSSGQTINAFMHDDRFLNINANTVPGLNVVKRLNPVTANFSEAYLQGMKDGQEDKSVRDSMSSMHKNTFRLTVQDVEQALLDDGVDTDEVAWLIDRLHYVDPWIANESEEKKEHGSRGLLNGELEAVLVQAIKDLSAKIDTLEDRLSTLEG